MLSLRYSAMFRSLFPACLANWMVFRSCTSPTSTSTQPPPWLKLWDRSCAILRPDVCLLTGDYRFEDHGPCEPLYPLMREIITNIHASLGIYGILGNHDSSQIALKLEEMGVRMLINESVEIGAYRMPLWLLGVDDPFDFRCHDLPRALAPVPPDSFRILLAHAPEIFEEAAASGIHLYLSGHTHGGQIRLPGIGAVRSNAHCPRSYTYGLWKHGAMQGHTSPGVGCSSLPIRFGCPPEATMIELKRASA